MIKNFFFFSFFFIDFFPLGWEPNHRMNCTFWFKCTLSPIMYRVTFVTPPPPSQWGIMHRVYISFLFDVLYYRFEFLKREILYSYVCWIYPPFSSIFSLILRIKSSGSMARRAVHLHMYTVTVGDLYRTNAAGREVTSVCRVSSTEPVALSLLDTVCLAKE